MNSRNWELDCGNFNTAWFLRYQNGVQSHIQNWGASGNFFHHEIGNLILFNEVNFVL